MSAEYNAKFANTDIATRAIHAGQEPDPTTGAVVTPISSRRWIVSDRLDGATTLIGGLAIDWYLQKSPAHKGRGFFVID